MFFGKKKWSETFFLFLEKMACNACIKENEDLFVKTVTEFDSQWSVVELLLVLNIQLLWARFCECEKLTDHCNVCRLCLIYKNEEFKIYKNSFNLDFLERFAQKASDLQIIRKKKPHLVCNLINRQFFYNHRDWFSREIESYSISWALDIYENNKIDEIKNSDFKSFK